MSRLLAISLTALAALFAAGVSVASAADPRLAHKCSYAYGAGDYQSVSYTGRTTCVEARVLIEVNYAGKRPRAGTRTAGTPHGRWRCTTVRRAAALGVVLSTHQTDCRLIDNRYRAIIRFFHI